MRDDLIAFDPCAVLDERRDDRDPETHDAIVSVIHTDGVVVVRIELEDGRELVATCRPAPRSEFADAMRAVA